MSLRSSIPNGIIRRKMEKVSNICVLCTSMSTPMFQYVCITVLLQVPITINRVSIGGGVRTFAPLAKSHPLTIPVLAIAIFIGLPVHISKFKFVPLDNFINETPIILHM